MSNERRVFATNDVETRSYGAALHLACLGHEVIGIRSRDNSNPYIRFKPDARPALENYYRQRDRLNTALERAMKPAEAALSAPEIEAKPLVRFRRGTELSAV